MTGMGILHNEMEEVLKRAQEIHDQTKHLAVTEDEVEGFVKAAEEAGLSRDATLQALRERLGYGEDAFEPGANVFAKSTDGHYYIAKVVSKSGTRATVRFCTGGEDTVSTIDLRAFSMVPGRKLQYFSPSSSWWWDADVVRVNVEGGSITVRCWGMEETVPFEKVRLPKEHKPLTSSERASLWMVGVSAALTGGAAGALLTYFLTR